MVAATPTVHVEIAESDDRGPVARVTIDYAAKRNSLTLGLLRKLASAFEALGDNDGLRCAVLTGAGDKAFVSGANLNELVALTPETARTYITATHRACLAIRELAVPVVARINGYCLGAGLELAAACDLRIAAQTAVFGMPEVRLGLPSVVEAALLPRLVGWGKAAEMVYLGRNYGADEALRMGLVEQVAPAGALDDVVNAYLDDLLAAGPNAIRAQKLLLRQWESKPLADAIPASIDVFARAFEGDEPERMMRPFIRSHDDGDGGT